jgi:hypothetical protein
MSASPPKAEICSNKACPLWAKSGHCQPYSMTSSAVKIRVCGTLRPSAFAVFRLITNSNLVGSRTGRSAAFSPLRKAFAERECLRTTNRTAAALTGTRNSDRGSDLGSTFLLWRCRAALRETRCARKTCCSGPLVCLEEMVCRSLKCFGPSALNCTNLATREDITSTSTPTPPSGHSPVSTRAISKILDFFCGPLTHRRTPYIVSMSAGTMPVVRGPEAC